MKRPKRVRVIEGWYAVHITDRRGGAFWAAWWVAPPSARPWRTPDAAGTMPFAPGVHLRDLAALAAERCIRSVMGAGTYVRQMDPSWAAAAQREAQGLPPRYRAPRVKKAPGAPRARARRPEAPPAAVGPMAAFQALGIGATATAEEIRRAFRRCVSEGRLHPDQGGDPEAFKMLEAHMRAALAWAEQQAAGGRR